LASHREGIEPVPRLDPVVVRQDQSVEVRVVAQKGTGIEPRRESVAKLTRAHPFEPAVWPPDTDAQELEPFISHILFGRELGQGVVPVKERFESRE
jgi:hypothetical protein